MYTYMIHIYVYIHDSCIRYIITQVATLSLHVVGAHGLPYAEMIKRQEKLAYYAQLAAVKHPPP